MIGEILGVYHAKACVFDDATLLTGANLSEEYFRSRQDRYVVVRDSKVADWYDRAVRSAAAAPDAGERARALRELARVPRPRPRRGAVNATGRGGGPRRRSSRRRKCAIFWTSTRARCPPCWTRVRAAASPRPTRTRRPPSSKRSGGRPRRSSCPPLARTASPARRAPRLSCRSRTRASPGTSRRSSRGRATCARGPRRARPTTPRAAGRFRRATSGASAPRSSGPRTGTCGRTRDVELGAVGCARRRSAPPRRRVAPVAVACAGSRRGAAGLDGVVAFCGPLPSMMAGRRWWRRLGDGGGCCGRADATG